MNFLNQNHDRQMSKSLSQYEQSLEKQEFKEPFQQDSFFHIQFGTNNLTKDLFYNTKKTPNKSTRRNKQSERYLNQKGVNAQKEKSAKVNHERYFSSMNKMNRQNLSNHQIPKTIHAQIQRYKNPKLIQIATRYGMYNERQKNIYLSIKKRQKNPSHIQKHQQQSKIQYRQSNIIIPRKKSAYKNYESVENNKISLGTLGVDMNHDKSMSLMLQRKNIAKTAQEYHGQGKNIELGIVERNKMLIQVPSVKRNKMQRKIQLFVHQEFDVDLNTIKAKLNNHTFENRNEKTQLIKTRENKQSKMAQKQFSNASQQIHLPFKINTSKHTSFNAIKKVPGNKEKRIKAKSKADGVQVIADSITFKKDRTSNQYFQSNDRYVNFCSRNEQKPQKQVHKETNLDNIAIIQRPKTHKDKRINTQAPILKKSRKQLFSAKPPEFTFIFDSKDHNYIAQYLISNGWGQYVASKLNNVHKLQWVNNPVASEILNLKESQFYNHFHKSFQLTSKSFLNSNLKANRHFLQTHQFFPDTYDIGNEVERDEFVQNFRYNVMIGLLEKMTLYCFQNSKHKDLIKTSIEQRLPLSQPQDFLKTTEQETKMQNQFFNAMEFENHKQPEQNFKLNIFLVILSLKFYQKERRRYDIDYRDKKQNFLMFKKDEFEKNIDMLEIYSQQEDVGKANTEIGLYSYHYATPSELLLKFLVQEYCFFSKIHSWHYNIQSGKLNVSNIWIVKPSSNARGNGIYLQKNMNSMLKSAKDIQSRIVQKYIQRPLLFKNTKYSHLNNHKFDLRQWVMLKSLDPLEIYMFSHFYVRLASEKYQSSSIDNNKIHLTNFSANKQFFKSNQHSIVNSDEFFMFLKQEYSVEWQTDLKPKIKEIIIKSIQACQQKLQTSTYGTCFQLLGYDILIDQNMTPWLIEVNMSPACEQRTDWLSEYLKNMNQGLLDIVLPESYLPKRSKIQRKQYWEKICYEEYFFTGKEFDQKLQVVSLNYQQKQKTLKQTNQGKSKSSLTNSMSPTKFKRKSRNQSVVIAQCRQKPGQSPIGNQVFQDNQEANILSKEMLLSRQNHQNCNSFVVNDFVEESIMQIEENDEKRGQNINTHQSYIFDDLGSEIQYSEEGFI